MDPPTARPLFRESDDDVDRRIAADMNCLVDTRRLSTQEKIALACRMLADKGHARTLAGQITARGDQGDSYWTTGFGVGFSEACTSNLVLIDGEMHVIG